jgi:hypothetical protein
MKTIDFCVARFPRPALLTGLFLALIAAAPLHAQTSDDTDKPPSAYPLIKQIDPPEGGFFTKILDFRGIPIKAPAVVVDEAMYRAYDRIEHETANLPMVISNLVAAGAQFHIIGRNQVTTDLPEWRQDKHVPLDEYSGITRDVRTRGMGGIVVSCGEENLLHLPNDRYRGNDICLHEFAHDIEGYGMGPKLQAEFEAQYHRSQSNGLWVGSYAGSNWHEYFAELTVWYFNRSGSLAGMHTPPPLPASGTEGFHAYDPEAFKLFDDFYSGRRNQDIPKLTPLPRAAPWVDVGDVWPPQDSLDARAIVAKLTSYKVGETKLSSFLTDAGMATADDKGTNGWLVTQTNSQPDAGIVHFNVKFLDPHPERGQALRDAIASGSSTPAITASNLLAAHSTTNTAAAANGARRRGGRGGNRIPNLADLEFKDGTLSNFKWNN